MEKKYIDRRDILKFLKKKDGWKYDLPNLLKQFKKYDHLDVTEQLRLLIEDGLVTTKINDGIEVYRISLVGSDFLRNRLTSKISFWFSLVAIILSIFPINDAIKNAFTDTDDPITRKDLRYIERDIANLNDSLKVIKQATTK